MTERTADAVVVGGGLSGLAAATDLARSGLHVVLVEKGALLGGRARTRLQDGFHWNVGPHALYLRGAAARELRRLGVPFAGGRPTGSDGYALRRGVLHTLPAGPVSLLMTGLLRPAEKLETARHLASLPRVDTTGLDTVPLGEWLEEHVAREAVRDLLAALTRVATYASDVLALSAAAALEQLRRALAGVLYLDAGWQTLVDSLRARAAEAGAILLPQQRAVSVEWDGRVRGLRTAGGTLIRAPRVLIAASPTVAASIGGSTASAALRAWAAEMDPVRAASLDVALRALPRPRASFAMGVDEPLYLSIHSAVARVAPAGGALVHVMRYGGVGAEGPAAVRTRLEALLEAVQPGWRSRVVHSRFVPDLTVAYGRASASRGGLPARPPVRVPDAPGLYVAGDWVGPEGLLADASLSSARAAAAALAADAATGGADAVTPAA